MSDLLRPVSHLSEDHELARLYRLQVRDTEDVALFLIDLKGTIASWNRGVERAFGYTEEEWIGQPSSLIFRHEDRLKDLPQAEMRSAAEEGRASDVRWHLRKDGSQVYMTGVLRSLRNQQGELIGYSKICLDDTARKLLEDALTQSNQDLQQFAFIASHDMQEPLRTITSFAQILRDRYDGRFDSEASRMLGFLVSASRRLSTLTFDLLEFSQLAREDPGAVSIQLDQDLEAALSLLQAVIKETGAVVTHEALPLVQVGRNQMVRLFQNLVGNSIKFRKPQQVPRIHVTAERGDSEWLIRVIDNGIGFPPEEAENIFAPFRRLHPRQEYPGSGIGLTTCKRIVESYGGRIGAESKPGEGATFWFTIPFAAVSQS